MTVLPACGSDAGQEAGGGSTDQTREEGAPAESCARMAEHDAATSTSDVTSVSSMVDSFGRPADAAAAAAARVAPNEIRPEHVRISDAAVALASGVKKRNPKTMAEAKAAADGVGVELEARFGNLDPETAKLVAFAKQTCTIDMR